MVKRFILALIGLAFMGALAPSALAVDLDMAVTLTGAATYNAGGKRTVTLTLTNNGPSATPAGDIPYVQIPFQNGVVFANFFQGAVPGPGGTVQANAILPPQSNGGIMQVNYNGFPSGGTAIITYEESVPTNTPLRYTHTATIFHFGAVVNDTQPANNTASLQGIAKTNADVGVSITNPQGTQAGFPRTMTITVMNNGPENAGNVVLTKNPAPGTTFGAFSQATGPTFTASGNPTNTFTIATLNSGASATFTYIENIPSQGGGSITDTATLTSDATDANALNNTASVTFNVTGTPVCSVAAVSAPEGNGAVTFVTFTASLTLKPSVTVTVDYATVDGTATAPKDYISQIGTLQFPPNNQTQQFVIAVVGNSVIEPNKTFTIHLSNPNGVTIPNPDSTCTIVNDDFGGAIEFSQSNFSVSEAAGKATITIKRTGGLASGVTVDYTTSDGTALAGTDYTFTSGTATFNAGEATTTFDVPLLNKYGALAGATVNLVLSNPTNTATLGSQSNGTLTILAAPAFSNPLLVDVLVNTQFSFGLTATGEQPVTFSAVSSALPQGLNFQAGFITGVPTQVGSFAVPITATNIAGADNKTLVINVTGIPIPPGSSKTTQDSDGDGFPDEIEAAAGSSAFDFKSTPIANNPAQVLGISGVKLSISLNFTSKNRDTITLKGSVPLPVGFRQSGKLVYFDIGGVVRRFALDDRGQSKIDGDSVKFKLGNSFFSQSGAFNLTLRGADAAALLSDEGLNPGASGPKSIPVVIMLNTNLYKLTQAQLYTSNGTKGKTRNP